MTKWTLPPEISGPLQELLQQDAQPVLDTFISDIQGAASKFVSTLPTSVQGPANLGVTLLTSIAAIAAQGELAIILKHNVPPVAAPTTSTDPATVA